MEGPLATVATPIQAIASSLRAQPQLCAVRFRGQSIANDDLLREVAHAIDSLRRAGAGPGTRIGLCLERNPDTLVLLLATWWLGAVYVPLDPALPRERLFAMCSAAALELLVTHPALRPLAERLPCALLVQEPFVFHATSAGARDLPSLPAPAPAAGDLAYILFTSGSSGTPKGVRISHGNLAVLFSGVLPLLQLPRGCRILGCASFSFDISFFELLTPSLCGGSLVLADASECGAPAQLLQLIEREDVNVVQATPSRWVLLTALAWTKTVAVAIATGEALQRATARAILRHARNLWNCYGPTECTIWSSAHRVGAQDLPDTAANVVCIGAPLPGYRFALAPSAKNAGAPANASGELVIIGGGVGMGYCGSSEGYRAGAAPSPDAPPSYHSGDLCRRDVHGLYHFLGRRDGQVKHNGYRIELDEIALRLQGHMAISQAACFVRPALAEAPSLLCACVVLRTGMPNRNKATLNSYLADYLPEWMLPQRYFFLERMPLTPQGKLDRAALLALAESANTQWAHGSLQTRVAAIFCEVLDRADIGPCDSFLDYGGSSMLAATLVLTLNERLGSELTLREALAGPPTVNSIVQLLRAQSASRTSS